MRSILGVAAATALPSEVWPFRKIFLPAVPPITNFWLQASGMVNNPNGLYRVTGICVPAIEMQNTMNEFLRNLDAVLFSDGSGRLEQPVSYKDGIWHSQRGLFT